MSYIWLSPKVGCNIGYVSHLRRFWGFNGHFFTIGNGLVFWSSQWWYYNKGLKYCLFVTKWMLCKEYWELEDRFCLNLPRIGLPFLWTEVQCSSVWYFRILYSCQPKQRRIQGHVVWLTTLVCTLIQCRYIKCIMKQIHWPLHKPTEGTKTLKPYTINENEGGVPNVCHRPKSEVHAESNSNHCV